MAGARVVVFGGADPWKRPERPGSLPDGERASARVSCGAMNKKHLPLFALIAALLGLASFSAGCRTMEGAGEDIERAGEKIQDNAK